MHARPTPAPTARDVTFARVLAMDSLRDLRRCERDFGPNDPVTRVARDCYASDVDYLRRISAAVNR